MKLKAFVVCAFLMVVSSSAFAQFFPASTAITVRAGLVTTQVFNPYYEPIVCNGVVFGQTVHGSVFQAFFAQQVLPAGDFRMAFVKTTPLSPFLNGWSNIQCRFVRW